MKQRILSLWCGLMAILVSPMMVWAQEESAALPNARFEGFARSVKVDPSSPALVWAAMILLAGICVAVLFKDAKRSHLD